MVPKVAGKGRSFVGAGLYYLHDKNASTRERVAFTHTENLPTRDADKAIKCMAYTAIRQQQLKARAGGSAKGRKLTQPVYCYSLSWAPGEQPSHEEMIAAAKDTLKELGLSGHEALLVGHRDEPHPHIHVIVNRVHPETGVAAKLSMDHLKLSAWAEEFERQQGQIRCEQRVENNALRRQGEFVKDHDSQHAAEFHRWRAERVDRQHDKRAMESAVLDARQERQRDQLRIARDRQVEEKRTRLRAATKADWRDLYTIQRKEQARLDSAQRNAWTRVRFFIRTHGEQFKAAGKAGRLQMIKGAFAALTGSKKQYVQLEQKQKSERVFFANKLKDKAKQLTEGIRKEHDEKLAELRKTQAAERDEMKSRHSEESQELAREIREGRDREQFRRERQQERKRELLETKRDIEHRKPEAKSREPSLSERFNKASRDQAKTADRGARGGKEEQPLPQHTKETQADRTSEFRKQAKDATGKREKPAAERKGSLAEKFRAAREAAPVEATKDREAEFKENAKDTSRDIGRERSRTRKPPGREPD